MPEVLLSPRAARDLDDIRQPDLGRIERRISALAHDSRPPGSKKLGDDLHRLRAGDWRILYAIDDAAGKVTVVRVLRRSERTYKDV